MDSKKIFEYLKEFSAIESESKTKYMIEVAINIIESKLKEKEKNNKNNSILNMLCVSLVNLWMVWERRSNYAPGSFAGNGYKITKRNLKQDKAAQKLFNYWRAKATTLFVDEGFYFCGIKEFCKT